MGWGLGESSWLPRASLVGFMGLLKSSLTSLRRAEPGSQWLRDRLNPWTPGSSELLSHGFCLLRQLWGLFSFSWGRKHHGGPRDITHCHRCLWQSPKIRRLLPWPSLRSAHRPTSMRADSPHSLLHPLQGPSPKQDRKSNKLKGDRLPASGTLHPWSFLGTVTRSQWARGWHS